MPLKTDDIALTEELSESDKIQSESLRLLMEPRLRTALLSSLAMLVVAVQMYGHANTMLVAIWMAVSLVIVVLRLHVKTLYKEHFLNAAIAVQNAFVSRNKLAWTLNAFIWGTAGWLFIANIPKENQYIGAGILLFVGIVAIHNLHPHRAISKQFINVLMGTQIYGAVGYAVYISYLNSEQLLSDVYMLYVHMFSLVVIWVMLHVFNNRLFNAFHSNMSLQFRHGNLIKTLNLKNEQLAHEKQVAMNANEVLQRFYASSAHDIRQPVYALKVYAELATVDADNLPALLPKITASCDAINRQFDSLFEFEQVSMGHIIVSHQTVAVETLIDDLEKELKPLARRKNLEFRTNTIEGYLLIDLLLVKRILTCFISNAIKYTQEGGILITMRKRQSMVVFEVWDTGIGIHAEHLEHVYDEFYKVDDFSSANEGFGLGLSVVKRLSAYAEGSTLSVNSKLGVGSVFRFALPIKIYSPPHVKPRFEKINSLPVLLDFVIE